MSACSSSIGSPVALPAAATMPHVARPVSSASSPASSSRAASVASGSALPVRLACESCRTRKLKCDGVQPACSRCCDDERPCVFATRKPIGRPKKRKGQEASSSQPDSGAHAEATVKRVKAEAAQRESLPPSQSAARASCCSDAPGDSLPSPATSSSSRMTIDPRELAGGVALSPRSTASSSRTSVSGGPALLRPPPGGARLSTSPSLDNLAVAAFLNSLDSLEIGSSDGLTSGMLDAWSAAPPQSPSMQGGAAAPNASWGLPCSVVDNDVSYAVPADFSWWAPDWLNNVPPSPAPPSGKGTALPAPSAYTGAPLQEPSSSSSAWPRGKDAGMGSGRLETEQGAILEGQGWEQDADPKLVQPADAKPCEATGAATCCCGSKPAAAPATGAQPAAPAAANAAGPSAKGKQRVHCVPNPSGKGCTCLCDVSVALLNVRGTLRAAASPGAAATASTPGASQSAGTTLHLTLSASQAVAAQCACSADCPTCRSDPSTQLSAGLLISTALQIYARAVSTLRRGFGASSPSSSSTQSASGAPDWDIRIGGYTPSTTNARRIALFAMKLELRDLRDAIGKVSRLAGIRSPPAADAAPASADGPAATDAINPVDQIVIRKLHQQLGELLRTVEALEGQD